MLSLSFNDAETPSVVLWALDAGRTGGPDQRRAATRDPPAVVDFNNRINAVVLPECSCKCEIFRAKKAEKRIMRDP